MLRHTRLAGAAGCLLLAPAAAVALELGEASMASGLGQPLRVEIPYRLGLDERLAPECIELASPTRAGALPTYAHSSRVAIGAGHIEIVGDARVLEPLIGLTVEVRCNTAPRLSRSYELFVDLPTARPGVLSNDARLANAGQPSPIEASAARAEISLEARTAAPAAAAPAASLDTPTPRASPSTLARGRDGGTLAQGEAYRVVRGDTLSGIASRVAAEPLSAPLAAPLPLPDAAPATNAMLLETPLGTGAAAAIAPDAEARATLVPSPAATVDELATEVVQPTTTRLAPAWLTALLALGVIALSSAPFVLVRRRKQEQQPPAAEKPAQRQPRPDAAVDPVAGIEVIEGALPRSSDPATAPSIATVAPSDSDAGSAPSVEPLALTLGSSKTVDLDVGAPVVLDERVGWFADRAANDAGATVEQPAATAEILALDRAAAGCAPAEPAAELAEPTVNDEQMTLTIAELDLLRQDYEAEHTLTQEGNAALRDALAELTVSEARAAAQGDAPTAELPQQSQPDEAAERARRVGVR